LEIVFADRIKLRQGYTGLVGDPNPMTGALLKGGKSGHRETDTQRRRPGEGGDGD